MYKSVYRRLAYVLGVEGADIRVARLRLTEKCNGPYRCAAYKAAVRVESRKALRTAVGRATEVHNHVGVVHFLTDSARIGCMREGERSRVQLQKRIVVPSY